MKIERPAWVTGLRVVDEFAGLKVDARTTVGDLQRAHDASGSWLEIEVGGIGPLRFRLDNAEVLAIAARLGERPNAPPGKLKATLTIEGEP